MAKKTTKKTKQPKQELIAPTATGKAPKAKGKPAPEKNVPVSKQTAGGVTGAILGAAVAGPLGALAGGLAGAVVGDASAKGKKPVKKAVDAIRSEIREAHLTDKLKSAAETVTTKIKSLRKGKKMKSPVGAKGAPASAAESKANAKPVKKKKAKVAATKKAAAPKKKKVAKKKS